MVHGHCLSSADHSELSSLFNLGQESSRWAMDRRAALAMANLEIPRSWNVLGSRGGDGEDGNIPSRWAGVLIRSTSGFYLIFFNIGEHFRNVIKGRFRKLCI